EPRLARIALPAGAAPQLVVDPPSLVALGAEDEQAALVEHLLAQVIHALLDRRQHLGVVLLVVGVARRKAQLCHLEAREVFGVAPELDVDAAAGHVGGDRHRAGRAGFGDRFALTLRMLGLGVEDRVLDPLARQPAPHQLRYLDRDGPDEYGLTALVALLYLLEHRRPLAVLGLVD